MSQFDDQIRSIQHKLRRLQDHGWEAHQRQFGVKNHQFQINPCISETELEAFEHRHGIVLPADYRQFLLQVGNGGAGPYYGILPLANWEDAARPYTSLPDGFIARPSPLYSGFQREQSEYAEEEAEEEYNRPYHGSIAVGEQGCGLFSLLIVSGEHRGRVCYINDQNIKAWFVRDTTFLDWYERWLDECLSGKEIWWFGCD